MNDWLNSLTSVEMLFVIGFVGTLVTIPLQDFISLGFYDITDFFVGLVATACSTIILNNVDTVTNLELGIIFIIIEIILVVLKISVILPFRSKAENSTTFSMKSIAGKQGNVTTTITKDSMGEVMVYAGFTRINKTAKIYVESEPTSSDKVIVEKIPIGTEILVIEVKDNILYVLPYTNDIKATKAEKSWNNN